MPTKETQMTSFPSIDHSSLASITGGNGAPNTTTESGNLGITVPTKAGPLQLGLQGSRATTSTNYAECVRGVRETGGGPADIRASCGLPGGGQ
jgi:hypothetical protein